MMTGRLKRETRELHEEIEKHSLAKLILEHTIDCNTHKLMLWQNYVAYKITGTEVASQLKDYLPTKYLKLEKDLFQLKVQAEIPAEIPLFECQSTAEAYGAAYVIEDSALGGMLLAKNLENCQQLNHIERHHFFNGDKTALNSWKDLKLKLIQENLPNLKK